MDPGRKRRARVYDGRPGAVQDDTEDPGREDADVTQPSLFGEAESYSVGPWTWLSNGQPKPWNRYRLGDTGWEIHHCGHPTANYPYYVVRPDGSTMVDRNGRGFRHLPDAKREVLEIVLSKEKTR